MSKDEVTLKYHLFTFKNKRVYHTFLDTYSGGFYVDKTHLTMLPIFVLDRHNIPKGLRALQKGLNTLKKDLGALQKGSKA